MTRFCIGLIGFVLIPAAAAADGGASSDCGGDAYTFAEVVPANSGRQAGPIYTVPDTLCADLAGNPSKTIPSLSIYLDRRGNASAQQPDTPLASPSTAPRRRY